MTDQAQSIKDQLPTYYTENTRMLLQGTEYETPAFFFGSGDAQPAILILGGTHGDEPAGYETALRLVKRFHENPLQAGKIIIIPLANIRAVENFNRRIPVTENIDREKGNLNRCYPGNPEGFPMEQLAYQIQQIAIENMIEVFIDLHEARRAHLETDPEGESRGLGQTIIYYPNEPSTWLVMQMLDNINEMISDPDKRFSSLERPIKNSGSWWAGTYLDIAAFTFETPRDLPIEDRINYHLALVQVVLDDRNIR
jgi:hypothetical protein